MTARRLEIRGLASFEGSQQSRDPDGGHDRITVATTRCCGGTTNHGRACTALSRRESITTRTDARVHSEKLKSPGRGRGHRRHGNAGQWIHPYASSRHFVGARVCRLFEGPMEATRNPALVVLVWCSSSVAMVVRQCVCGIPSLLCGRSNNVAMAVARQRDRRVPSAVV